MVPKPVLSELEHFLQKYVPPSALKNRGRLTTKGVFTLLALGKQFRKLYRDEFRLLSPSFDPREVYLRSTTFPRALESIQALMLGMFPECFTANGTPMEINIRQMEDETMFRSATCCKEYLELEKTFENIFRERFGPPSEVILGQVECQNFQNTSREAIYYLHDAIKCCKANDQPIPPRYCLFLHKEESHHVSEAGSKENLSVRSHFEVLEELSMQSTFGIHWAFNEAPRMRIGRFVQEIARNFQDCQKEELVETQPKFFIYSGHDENLVPILVLFDLLKSTDPWPPFGASIIFELFHNEDDDQRYVRMKYLEKPVVIKGKGSFPQDNEEFCRLDKFLEICHEMYFVHADCKMHSKEFQIKFEKVNV